MRSLDFHCLHYWNILRIYQNIFLSTDIFFSLNSIMSTTVVIPNQQLIAVSGWNETVYNLLEGILIVTWKCASSSPNIKFSMTGHDLWDLSNFGWSWLVDFEWYWLSHIFWLNIMIHQILLFIVYRLLLLILFAYGNI